MTEMRLKIILDAEIPAAEKVKQVEDALGDVDEKTKKTIEDFSGLTGEVDKFMAVLEAATPENQQYAATFQQIQQDLEEGKISIEEAKTAVQGLQEEMGALDDTTEQTGDGLEKTSLSLTDLKSGIDLAKDAAQAAGQVFVQAFEMGKEGATILATTDSLTRMAEEAGYAGDLIGDLEAAAGGTVDDLDYMGSSLKTLANTSGEWQTELANTLPDLMNVSRAVVKLNPTLGTSAEVFDAMTQALMTGQTRGLKPYGFQIDATASAQEQLNQIMAQGQGMVDKLGGNVESAVDPFNRLENSVDNLKDTILTGLAPALTAAAEGANTLLTWQSQLDAAMATHNQEVADTSTTYEDYVAEMQRAAEAAGMQLVVTDQLTEAEAKTMGAVLGLTEAQWQATQATEEATVAEDVHVTTLFEMVQAYNQAYDGVEKTRVASEIFADRLDKVNEEAEIATKTFQDLQPKVENLADTLNQNVGSPLSNFIEDIQFFMASGGRDFAAEFDAINDRLAEKIAAEDTTPAQAAMAMNQAREEAAKLLVEWEKVQIALGKETDMTAAESIAETMGITVEQAILLMQDFDKNADAVFGQERAIAINANSLDELHEKLIAAEGDISSLESAAKGVEGTYNINFEITTNGQIPNVDGSDPTNKNGNTSAVGLAGGADFIVPPGYPNDSYGPLYVQSGERVQVTPAGDIGKERASSPIVVNVYVDGRQLTENVMVEIRERGRLNAGSGLASAGMF